MTREGTVSEAGPGGVRFPPPLIYLGGLLAGLGIEFAAPTGSLPFPFAAIALVVGLTMFLVLGGAALVRFNREGTSPIPETPATTLVTEGPFRFSRNPMYLGMAFLYAGLALALGLYWSLPLLPAVVLVVDRVVIPPEERHLEAQFGEDYRAYRRRVRKWI